MPKVRPRALVPLGTYRSDPSALGLPRAVIMVRHELPFGNRRAAAGTMHRTALHRIRVTYNCQYVEKAPFCTVTPYLLIRMRPRLQAGVPARTSTSTNKKHQCIEGVGLFQR